MAAAPSSSSVASRRELARAALPPFTLPPPPELPRTLADTLSPPTPASSLQQPAGSPYSTGSSPGYSHSSHASRPPSASRSPYESSRPRLAPSTSSSSAISPGPAPDSGMLSHAHARSPRKPLPGSGVVMSPTSATQLSPPRFAALESMKLPPIASLIPPPASYAPPAPRSPSKSHGYLAMPIGGLIPRPAVFKTGTSPPGLRGPLEPPAAGPKYYHEFAVPEYSIVRESSQQDRPFKCDLCTQCFSRNHDLKRHKRIHMAAKPFPCPTCNKSFSRRDALKRHRLVKACYKKSDGSAPANGVDGSRQSSSPDAGVEFTSADWKPPGASGQGKGKGISKPNQIKTPEPTEPAPLAASKSPEP